jgi:hypothetical protein
VNTSSTTHFILRLDSPLPEFFLSRTAAPLMA